MCRQEKMEYDMSTSFWSGNSEWVQGPRGRRKLRGPEGLTNLGKQLYGARPEITVEVPACLLYTSAAADE